MKKIYAAALVFLVLGLFLCACGRAPATPPSFPAPTSPVEAAPEQARTVRPVATGRFTSLPRPSPSSTPSPTESATPSQTLTSTPTLTPTPEASLSRTATLTPEFTLTPSQTQDPSDDAEPTPTAFPMSIAAMRAGSYPGSEIVIDEELEPGVNYRRYYAYYLSQGLKIYALLTVPDGEVPAGGWPGIVFNHGYIPPEDYRTTERYIDYVHQLARSGYVVFRIDYRGHDNSEGDAQGAYGDPGYAVDVLNAVASLKQFPQVNPEKIGMWGHSMGGYLTLRAMVISPDVKVGVIWAGVVASYPDLLYNWPMGPSIPPANSRKWMEEWPAQFGSPEENPTFWSSISAHSYLEDLSGPLQLHYGTFDQDVPPGFSETLGEQIRAVGGDVEVYGYLGDNHNIGNSFNQAMDRTIAFFDAVLK